MAVRVLIIGGGMVGLSFGLTIRRALPDAHISILEAKPLPEGTPDPLDSRASALNLASHAILSGLGVWGDLAQHVGIIRHIHVSNQSRFGSAVIDNTDVDGAMLGYVVENHQIGRALKRNADQRSVVVEAPAKVAAFDRLGDRPAVILSDGQRREADLVVVADGSQSSLREQLGISCNWRRNGQCAVVANVSFGGVQQGIAFERFTPHGPIAVLPLSDMTPNEQRFNVVWSMAAETAVSFETVNDQAFLDAFQRAFGWRLGRALRVGRRNLWPLDRVMVREQRRGRFLIAGNAAHGLHPVAGQGLNLSLRDAANLGATLRNFHRLDDALTMEEALASYEQAVTADQERIVDATDLLSTLFNRRGTLLDFPRDAALSGLDLLKPLRRDIARQGTGLDALSSRGWDSLFSDTADQL